MIEIMLKVTSMWLEHTSNNFLVCHSNVLELIEFFEEEEKFFLVFEKMYGGECYRAFCILRIYFPCYELLLITWVNAMYNFDYSGELFYCFWLSGCCFSGYYYYFLQYIETYFSTQYSVGGAASDLWQNALSLEGWEYTRREDQCH